MSYSVYPFTETPAIPNNNEWYIPYNYNSFLSRLPINNTRTPVIIYNIVYHNCFIFPSYINNILLFWFLSPSRPVSAYALFFRDTQAAIKTRKPSASFGEVSKIVASMWDGLDEDNKGVSYSRTTDARTRIIRQTRPCTMSVYLWTLTCVSRLILCVGGHISNTECENIAYTEVVIQNESLFVLNMINKCLFNSLSIPSN